MIGTVRGMMLSHKEVAGLPAPIASFRSNASGVKLDSLKVLVEAQQDLHGYDKPWAGGGGKNKCEMTSNPIILSTDGNIGNQTCVIPSGTYTFSWTSSQQRAITLKIWNGSTTIATVNSPSSVQGRGSVNFTISENATHLTCYFNGATSVSDIQIEAGSTATSYAPYENICPITGWSGANVTRCGVNVWDEQTEIGAYNNQGEKINYNVLRNKNVIKVKGLSSVYFYCGTAGVTARVVFYTEDMTCISSTPATTLNSVITIPNNACYMSFNLDVNYGTTYAHNVSINYPSTDTNYHAYNGNTYTIPFGQQVFKGELDVTTGLLRVTHQIYTFNGTEQWITNGVKGVALFINSINPQIDTSFNPLFEIYKTINRGEAPANNGEANFNYAYTAIQIHDERAMTATEYKNLLSNNNVKALFKLATPFTIQLSPQQIEQLEENNIWADTGDVSECKYSDRVVTVLFSKG